VQNRPCDIPPDPVKRTGQVTGSKRFWSAGTPNGRRKKIPQGDFYIVHAGRGGMNVALCLFCVPGDEMVLLGKTPDPEVFCSAIN